MKTSPAYLSLTSQSKKSNASGSKSPLSELENSSRGKQKYGGKEKSRTKFSAKSRKIRVSSGRLSSPSAEDASDEDMHIDLPEQQVNGNGYKTSQSMKSFGKDGLHTARTSSCMGDIEAQQDCASGGKNFQTSTQSPSKVIF